jgi:FkbM family methyltransferase
MIKLFNLASGFPMFGIEEDIVFKKIKAGTFEQSVSLFFRGVCSGKNEKKFSIIDIGAHMGHYSVLSSALCENVTVYAFEPDPRVFEVLKKNSSLYKQIIPYEVAIGKREFLSDFYLEKDYSGGSSFLRDSIPVDSEVEKIEVQVKEINSFGIDFSKVEIVKIDTQGTETLILNELCPLLKAGTLIVIEPDKHLKKYVASNQDKYKLSIIFGTEELTSCAVLIKK